MVIDVTKGFSICQFSRLNWSPYLWICLCYSNNPLYYLAFHRYSVRLCRNVLKIFQEALKMDKKSKKSEANKAEASEKPTNFTALYLDPKYKKANAEFLTRRLRLEFNKFNSARRPCREVSSVLTLPPELQKTRKFNLRAKAKRPSKRSKSNMFSIRPFSTLSRISLDYLGRMNGAVIVNLHKLYA